MSLPAYKGDIQALFFRPCVSCICKRLEMINGIDECLACGHRGGEHKSMEDILPGILKKLVLLGKTNNEICIYLEQQNIRCSLRTLKRRLHDYGIRRTEDIDPDSVLNVVQVAQEQRHNRAGYRQLHMMIRQQMDIPIKRSEVERALRAIDPKGPKRRLSRRCKKRVFICPGPDYIWSIDGHDKLASFGIYIHGCIDAFSRKILWCHTYNSNKKPCIVAKYFLDKVEELQVAPCMARMDPGVENNTLVEIQMHLRRNDTDLHAGKNSACVFDSKLNQKIECFWSGLYNKVTSPLRTKFRIMASRGLAGNPQYREAFLYVFLPLVTEDVNDYICWWNNHRIRKQSGVALPTGDSPDNMYYMPEKFDAEKHGFCVSTQDIRTMSDHHNLPDELDDIVSPGFRNRADGFLLQNRLVVSRDTAEAVFEALCTLI